MIKPKILFNGVKTCLRCNIEKDIEEFYLFAINNRKYRASECKVCNKLATQLRQKANPKKRDAIMKISKAKKPELYREIRKRADRRYPEKAKARSKLREAVRHGRLERQPCLICGILPVDAHHPDYSKPLDVMWLCRRHHQDEHNRLRASLSNSI